MTDSSDFESDAGASPSVCSDGSAASSSRSSSPALKIVCETPITSTPKKRISINGGGNQVLGGGGGIATPGTSSTSGIFSPVVAERKSTRKRQAASSNMSNKSKKTETALGSQNGTIIKIPTTPLPLRKRKKSSKCSSEPGEEPISKEDTKLTPETKRQRNKRRRTRSERNLLAGKSASPVKKAQEVVPVVAEGEEAVALDAEIDRVLEEKAIKNNLSATNVKSIIRHVITNNMVQKMIMSAMKKKAENADGGGSSDEDGILEPKMTRAKIKELMGTKVQLWPIVDSPVKINKAPVSETHMLIQNDLPEDSSGEEYVPMGADISEMAHVTTDDEASSVVSFSSDSVSPSSKKQGVSTRRSLQTSVKSPFNDSMFKTPPPRPKSEKKDQVESAIGLRTRSKHPLNDTPLEDLERLFIPPDITQDMYDFGLEETDHKEYVMFCKNFYYSKNDVNEHDDDADPDADPEYNVMEDDEYEDLHDREELRMDRAVKVPKKELTELIAELFEPGVNSGDDMDDHDLASLTGITPLAMHPNEQNLIDSGQGSLLDMSGHNTSLNIDCGNSSGSFGALNISGGGDIGKVEVDGEGSKNNTNQPNYVPQILINEINSNLGATTPDPAAVTKIEVVLQSANDVSTGPTESVKITLPPENSGPPLFGKSDLPFLQQQIRQHIQLLCQSYVLTVSTEDTALKGIAKTAKSMVLELKNFSDLNGDQSCFSVCNLSSAWNLVNFWPHKFLQQSPIKKKILEEKYISEVGGGEGKGGKLNYFPRHVVKVIAENSTFLYNHLLPESYLQNNHQNRCTFNYWEDALLVSAVEDLKEVNSKLSAKQLAEAISETLLIVHPVNQVYHRLRNLRKSNLSSKNCDPEIVKYFKEGKLPEPDRTVIEIEPSKVETLIQRDRRGVSTQWMSLLQHIEESSTFKWEENLSKDPVTKSLGQKWSKNRVKKNAKPSEPLTMPPPPSDDAFFPTIDRVFPNGTLELDTSKPDMEAFPVLNSSGRPGAIIYIPKYALNAEGGNPFKSPSKGTVPRDREGGRQPLADFNGNGQQRVGDEAGLEAQQPYDSTASTVNILGLQQLIRTARTPLKNSISSPTKMFSPLPFRVGYSVVQPEFHKVGKPFDLPEDIKSKQFEANDIIDLRMLQTPLKQQVLQSALGEPRTAQESTKSVEDIKNEDQSTNDLLDASSSSDSSCNVIFEGTEYELSDGYDDESVGTEAPPELVTLLSSDEEDVKPVNADGDVKHVSVDGSYDLPPPPTDGDGKTTKGDSNSKKNEAAGSSNNNSKQATSSANSSSTATSARKYCGAGGKGDDSDDDGERKNNRKRNLPKGCKDDLPMKEEEKVPEKQAKPGSSNSQPNKKQQTQNLPGPSSAMMMQAPSVSTPKPPTTPQQSANASNGAGTSKSQKKAKRSPGNQGSSRRSSKYNVTSTEKMLQEDTNDFDEVADAYMEAYLAKVQSTTEAKHPGVYATFVQMLLDVGTGPVNQTELHAKVKVLFKEYPDLLREFESFLDPTLDSQVVDETNQMLGSTAHEETVAQIKFIQQLEKFTENCPHLKAKVMNKVKSLKESGCLTDKEVATSLEPFFVGNPVIMDAFKCLFPSVYRPQSVSAAIDFEEIELDMEDPPKDSTDESMKYEIVKLPEETNVLATSTCPCVCHTKTSDPAFANRSKHCRKCSLKFQDGKIYIQNGKVMRPVSVELKKF